MSGNGSAGVLLLLRNLSLAGNTGEHDADEGSACDTCVVEPSIVEAIQALAEDVDAGKELWEQVQAHCLSLVSVKR